MSAAVEKTTGNIFLVYAADLGDAIANDDIRTAVYSSGAWSAGGNVITNASGSLSSVGIGIDENTADAYVTYGLTSTFGNQSTGDVFWKQSTDNMTSWGAQEGPLNTTQGDIYGISLNLSSPERIYTTWFEAGGSDRFGATVANIGPDTILDSIGNQLTEARAGATDTYVGGAFALSSQSSRTVSNFVINEVGTIDAQNGLKNIKLYYDLDTSAPYDCTSESYGGGEAQFGATDSNGFSGANGESSFGGSIVGINSTQTMCIYVVLDVPPQRSMGAL
jgi:hypothetical protein